jgi:prephenate dehydratase
MKKIRIALSGIPGSFSEEATQKYLREAGLSGELVFATTSAHTLELVSDGEADYGLLPLENSNGGIVLETVYATARYGYEIDRILEIDVQQNLLALPGTKIDDITGIVSHQQALAQCKMFLRRRWHGELHEYDDTALAAKDLKEGTLPPTTAVIASRRAAELYKLEIMEPSIQDLKFNYTSFVVVHNVVPAFS